MTKHRTREEVTDEFESYIKRINLEQKPTYTQAVRSLRFSTNVFQKNFPELDQRLIEILGRGKRISQTKTERSVDEILLDRYRQQQEMLEQIQVHIQRLQAEQQKIAQELAKLEAIQKIWEEE